MQTANCASNSFHTSFIRIFELHITGCPKTVTNATKDNISSATTHFGHPVNTHYLYLTKPHVS